MRKSALYLFAISVLLIIIHTPLATAQDNVVEVRRDQLAPNMGQGAAGTVLWFLASSGTRRQNVQCTIENDSRFRNNNAEVVFRLTDNGGLAGDAGCDFNMRFEGLRNSFVFHSVTMDAPLVCGNPPCSTTIVRTNDAGDTSFNVLLRLNMKGVPSILAWDSNRRLAVVRVRLNLSSPADRAIFSPFITAFIPNLYVSKIKAGFSLTEKKCQVGVTLVNDAQGGWVTAQPGAYASNGTQPDRRVFVTLKRDGEQCGVASMSLIDFDPNRNLNLRNGSVSATWPGCTFSPGAKHAFTVTVDSNNQLVEESETGKTKTVQESCLTLPGGSPINP